MRPFADALTIRGEKLNFSPLVFSYLLGLSSRPMSLRFCCSSPDIDSPVISNRVNLIEFFSGKAQVIERIDVLV